MASIGNKSYVKIYGQRKEELALLEKDYASSHGIVMRPKDDPNNPNSTVVLPFTLFPSPVPKSCFEYGVHIQKSFNVLMHKVANDYEFLRECLQSTIKVDDFTRRLWTIYETVRKEGVTKPVTLAMNRSDYMFDTKMADQAPAGSTCIKQVEFNTMAASFGGMAPRIADMHRLVLSVLGEADSALRVPANGSCEGLATALVEAWRAYGNLNAVVVFLVLPPELNVFDQRHLEFAVYAQEPKLRVFRRTLHDFRDKNRVRFQKDRKLFIDDQEVSVIYQRCCYMPEHFADEQDWEVRLLMEHSLATTCPSIHYHLAGTKKVQQVLAEKGRVEKYLPATEATEIRKTFVNIYSLDQTPEGDENVERALKAPDQFVLKPQREGGGNNVYGSDIKDLLLKLKNSVERTAYILMEKITPPPALNIPIRKGVPAEEMEMISELGIFGTFVARADGTVILNASPGYNLRTKPLGTDEGGVATGFSFLDSPLLLDQ